MNPVGKSVYTREGIEAFRNATVENRLIRPVKFRVSKDNIEIYNGIPSSEFRSYWYEGRVAGYRIDKDRAEIILEVPPDKAAHDGATFALLDESNTILMLAKPPFPFPPLMRQRLLVQIVWQNLDEIVEFKYLPATEYEQHLVDWEAVQYFAEFVRQELSSGIVSQTYGIRDPQLPMEENSVATVGWSVIGMHNHPNYQNMPGLGWFVVNANGFLFQTRHNDYRCQKKTTGFLATEYAYAPTSPNYTIDQMKDLFSRYLSQSLTDEEKKLFRWDLAYLEAFFVEIDSPFDSVEDLFTSFRHTLGTQTVLELAKSIWKQRITGKKVRFENSGLFPFIAKEDGKYIALLYRILVQPLPQFNGKLWSEIIKPYEEYETDYIDFYSVKKRFEWKKEIDLHSIWQSIAGLDGEGAEILSLTSEDGYTIAGGINYAYYHQKYTFAESDAVNMVTFNEGWNDVTLIVAHTKNTKVYGGVSFLIPLELILRTPLESWNPFGLPYQATVTGSGTADNPYNGINPNGRWFLTPSEFFVGNRSGLTVADTSTSPRYVKDSSGNPRLVYPSGIWTVLPEIKEVGKLRIRFPVYWDAHEKGMLGHFISIANKRLNSKIEELAALQLYQAVLNYENIFGEQV